MTKGRDILVVGAGVIGAACAERLAQTGARVTILDEGVEERQASSGSLAWLNVSSASDPDYARLRAASLRLWREMSRASGAPVDWRGSLLWSDDGGEMSEDAAFLTAIDCPARAIDAEEMRRLVPGLAPPAPHALHAPAEGVADPRRVTDWMLERAIAAGAKLMRPARVEALTEAGGRIDGVALQGGDRIAADEVIVACGHATPALLAPLGRRIPLNRAPGGLVLTTPGPQRCGPVLATPGLDFWQAADGRFLIGTSPGATLEAAGKAAETALTELCRVLPECVDVGVERVILRERPVPLGGFPAVGPLDGLEGLFVIVTHSGMTLAPIMAEAAAAHVAGAAPPLDLARWRPDRDFAMDSERRRS